MIDLNEMDVEEIRAQMKPEALAALRAFTEDNGPYTDLLEEGKEMSTIDPLSASVMLLAVIAFFNPEDEEEENLSFPQAYNDALKYYGLCQMKLGAYKYAVGAFDDLCGLEPDNADHYSMLAISLLEEGDFSAAEDIISHVPELNPDAAMCLVISKHYYGRKAELLKDQPQAAAKATAEAVQYARLAMRNFSEADPMVWDAAVLWLQEINPQKPANPAPSGPPGP